MGVAASLFYSTDPEAQTLHRRIKPSDSQYEDQQTYWNHLAEWLKSKLSDRTGVQISTWLQGSYKFGTQIRPHEKGEEFDIDLGLYFEWDGKPSDGMYTAADLKSFVQEELESYCDDLDNDANDVSPPKSRCSRIHFTDDFHIDVPAYHLNRASDVRFLAAEPSDWELSDPKEIYLWWKDSLSDEQRPRARRVVQYLKMWAALHFESGSRPSSILLTVLTAIAFGEVQTDDISGDDEWFAAIVDEICDSLEDSMVVVNPVNSNENLNRLNSADSKLLRDKFNSLRTLSGVALSKDSKSEASDAWTDLFHHFFPVPDEEDVIKESSTALIALEFLPEVSIVATHEAASMYQYTGINAIGLSVVR